MTLGVRVASLTMVLVMLCGGPLAPVASAQQPAAPDTRNEMMKQPSLYDPKPEEKADVQLGEEFHDAAAGVMTALLVPGRAVTCLVGGSLAAVVLVLTLGSGHRAAGAVLQEGCGGKWIVRGEDLAPNRLGLANPPGEKK